MPSRICKLSSAKRRVLIDLSKTKSLYNGPGQFCIRLGNELDKLADHQLHPTFLINKNRAHLLPNSSAKQWINNLSRETSPSAIKALMALQQPKFDLWHVTAQDSSFWPLNPPQSRHRIPTLLTIHDLNFLREKSDAKIEKRLATLQAKVDRAEAITTISNFSASEIRSHLNLNSKPLITIHNGGPIQEETPASKPAFADNRKILFTLGELTAKKNVHTLLPLVEESDEYHLIIAGKNSTHYGNKIRKEIRRKGLDQRVTLPGTIPNKERLWLYQNCSAFLFPSLTEGFGLPVLEAMQFGKPVFMSNSTSLPEIGGDAGFYWSSYEPDVMKQQFRQGMQTYYTHSPSEFEQRAKQRAAAFTWAHSAQAYWRLYKELLKI